jgi:hypothetical protein
MLVFHAADMAARLERLRALGFELASAPTRVHASGNSARLEGPGSTALLLLEAAD